MAKSQLPFWLIFSVTFLSRPFGGLVFAAIADMVSHLFRLFFGVFVGVFVGVFRVLSCVFVLEWSRRAPSDINDSPRRQPAPPPQKKHKNTPGPQPPKPKTRQQYGRKPCLLASVITMGVPSVLIGCLPTYAHIGLAAPILLAICRLVQGLALGGEYTAAVITAYELSPADAKNLGGAVAFAAGSVGTLLGVAVPMIVYTSVSEQALFVWGWRVPFLASVVTAGVALLLRSLMVEPDEFVEQQERDALLAEAEAAAREGGVGGEKEGAEAAGGGGGGVGLAADGAKDGGAIVAADDAARTSSSGSETATLATVVAVRPSAPMGAAAAAEEGKAGAAAAAAAAAAPWWQPASCRRRPAAAAAAALGAGAALPPPPPRRRAHRAIPVRAAFAQHWRKIVLQCLFTAASTASAFAFTAWLPLLLITPPALLPRTVAYGMVLIIVTLSIPVGLIAARVCDRGLVRPVTLSVCAILVGAAVILTYFLAAVPLLARPGRHAALVVATLACIVPHNVVYGSLANVMGRIYPANLRVTAFSTGHNVASSVFGGFAPLIMTALHTAWPWRGPAVYLASLCAVSAGAGLLMVRLFPGMNALPAEAELLRAGERAAAEAEAAERGAALRRAAAPAADGTAGGGGGGIACGAGKA